MGSRAALGAEGVLCCPPSLGGAEGTDGAESESAEPFDSGEAAAGSAVPALAGMAAAELLAGADTDPAPADSRDIESVGPDVSEASNDQSSLGAPQPLCKSNRATATSVIPNIGTTSER